MSLKASKFISNITITIYFRKKIQMFDFRLEMNLRNKSKNLLFLLKIFLKPH